MQNSSSLQLTDVKIYQFEKKIPTLLNGNKWLLKQIHKYEAVFINESATVQVYIKNQVVSITYENAKAYFARLDKGFISIHFPIANENIEIFEYKLQENDIRLNDWEMTNNLIKKDIQRQCGSKINKEKYIEAGGLQKVGLGIGKVFGAINKIVRKPVDTATQSTSSKIQQVKEKHVSQESRSKWQNFKNKVSSINDKVNEKCRPVTTSISEAVSEIGDNFEKSDNKVIKGVRDFSEKVKNSMNKGYRTSMEEKPQVQVLRQEKQMEEKKVEENQVENKEEEPKIESNSGLL